MNELKFLSSFKAKPYLALSFSLLLAASCGGSGSSGSSVLGGAAARNETGEGPAAVSLSKNGGALEAGDLASAGSYVILSKTGISNVTGSTITGHIGASPVTESSITGFALSAHATGVYYTSASVVGNVYAAEMSAPTTPNLTTAIGSMETAYTNAAGRVNPDFTELGSGDLGGLTLVPGLYKWSTNVNIPTNVTISGSATDVWIFQIAGNLDMAAGLGITLLGGALPENIFWQVAGEVNVQANSDFQGIILCKTAVNFVTNATMTGRILSQTFVALDDNIISEP